jgi:DNA-binding transcriptional ArsR family regulator
VIAYYLDMKDITIILKVLSDPTRRSVFETVAQAGEIGVSMLTRRYDVSQPAISQHLKQLRDAGLVIERREGREAFYRVVTGGLQAMEDWIARYR